MTDLLASSIIKEIGIKLLRNYNLNCQGTNCNAVMKCFIILTIVSSHSFAFCTENDSIVSDVTML